MRGGLQSPVAGWAVFEAVEPGSELLTFAGGAAYEARSPLRVLGKQTERCISGWPRGWPAPGRTSGRSSLTGAPW